jgi:hypothetical protein
VFRVLSALLTLCLLAQVVVTGRPAQACDGAAVSTTSHSDGATLHRACCCEPSGAPCSPECDECACCPHHRPMTLQKAIGNPILARFEMDYARPVELVPRPHADEILHIPKSAHSG